jgi:hypothetical protein
VKEEIEMKARMAILILLVAALGVGAAGCSAKKQQTLTVADLEQRLQQKDQEIGQLQSSVGDLEKELERKETEAQKQAQAAAEAEAAAREVKAKARAAETEARSNTTETRIVGAGDLFPPNAKTGECYTRVFVPPTYRTETERVLRREASARIEVVPARYETVQERVLVKEASERLEVVPAVYDWIEEKVLVKQASSRLETVPAVYDWVEEKVLVESAHTTWKKGRGPIEKVDDSTGEIMCLVEVPARYETVKKRVLKTPAKTVKVEIPAEYKTVKKKVMTKPPTTRKVETPAEYETVKVRKMVSPPQERPIEIPAEYETVTKTVKVTEGRMDWRPILCETNMTRVNVMDIQRALLQKGHSPGPIDGIYGNQTKSAVHSFQQANELPTGALTMGTVRALGLSL